MTPGGHAQQLLEWRWAGLQLEAQIARCTYFCRARGRELLAWCELRDPGGRWRVEIGSFRDVSTAKAACELHAAALCRRDQGANGTLPVDVRIARGRRRARIAGEG